MVAQSAQTGVRKLSVHNRLMILGLDDTAFYSCSNLADLVVKGVKKSAGKNLSSFASRSNFQNFCRKEDESDSSLSERISEFLGEAAKWQTCASHKSIKKVGKGRPSEAYTGFIWKWACGEKKLKDTLELACVILKLSTKRSWSASELLSLINMHICKPNLVYMNFISRWYARRIRNKSYSAFRL